MKSKLLIYHILNKLILLKTHFSKKRVFDIDKINSICVVWPLCLGDSIMQFPFLFEFIKKHKSKNITIITDRNQISSYLIDKIKKEHNLNIQNIKLAQSFKEIFNFLNDKYFDIVISPFGFTTNNFIPLFFCKFKYFFVFYSLNNEFTLFKGLSNVEREYIMKTICINDPREMALTFLNTLDIELYQKLELLKYDHKLYEFQHYFRLQLDKKTKNKKDEKYFVVHVRGTNDRRHIEIGRWIKEIKEELIHLKNTNKIIFIGTTKDKKYTEEVIYRMKRIKEFQSVKIVKIFNSSYENLIYMLTKTESLICSDTGIMHLGVFSGVKKIKSIFNNEILPIYRLPMKYLEGASSK